MNKLFRLLSLIIISFGSNLAVAQELNYRVSMTEEATSSDINDGTPLNRNNTILPQPNKEQINAWNAYAGYNQFMGSIGFSMKSNSVSHPSYDFAIHELTMDIPLTDELSIIVGKKIMKWGTGYAFNPTGVAEPPKSPSDPSDRLKLNDGRNVAEVTYLSGKSSLSFVFQNDAAWKAGKFSWDKDEFACRAYTFLGGLDLSVVAHYREGDRLQVGSNFSYVIGDNLELHGEALAERGTSSEYHHSLIVADADTFFTANAYSTLYSDANNLFWKVVAGGQYTFDTGLNIVLEYYHNDEGLTRGQWGKWMNFVKFHDAIQNNVVTVPPQLKVVSKYNLLDALHTLSARGTLQDYLFNRWYYSSDGWSGELLVMVNLDDWSSVEIPTASYRFSENVSGYVRYTQYNGKSDSEYGSLFIKKSVTLGIGVQI